MSMALLIICLVSGTLSFISFLVGSQQANQDMETGDVGPCCDLARCSITSQE